jgi:hypothetical protein
MVVIYMAVDRVLVMGGKRLSGKGVKTQHFDILGQIQHGKHVFQ